MSATGYKQAPQISAGHLRSWWRTGRSIPVPLTSANDPQQTSSFGSSSVLPGFMVRTGRNRQAPPRLGQYVRRWVGWARQVDGIDVRGGFLDFPGINVRVSLAAAPTAPAP
jgi:hypothetical protein